ncbi:MAG TPA: 50S ribosomal protein L9 [Capsulimonadaceae bacterium]|jgi:large subunit ribosomal protein L9
MKVILLQDIPSAGKQGDVITVTDGYGRNYLFPRKLAVAAEGGALKNLEAKKALEGRRSEKIVQQAEADKAKLEGKTITIAARSGEGKLYGRITTQDIADAIGKDLGVKLDKRKISLVDAIKQLGEYNVPVKLHKDIIVDVKVTVAAA